MKITYNDMKEMKKEQLLQYCTDNNIKAFKSWNKTKIIDTIKESEIIEENINTYEEDENNKMLVSENQVIINSNNLNLICNYENRYSYLNKNYQTEIYKYTIIDNKGNVIKENDNNIFKLVHELDKRSLKSELDNIIFCLENNLIDTLENILLNNSKCRTDIIIKSVKSELEQNKKDSYNKEIHESNSMLKIELNKLLENTMYLYNINLGTNEIILYKKLDNKVSYNNLNYVLESEEKNKYIEVIGIFNDRKNKYMHEILNDNLKSVLKYIKDYLIVLA